MNIKNNSDKKFIVYKHTSPSNKVYIGITCQRPERRWGKNGEKYLARHSHFRNAILKYGWDNFKHDIIASELSKEEACEKEQEFIKEYKSNNPEFGYNLTSGGEYYEINEELRIKFSQVRKGHPTSEETREKIRKANTGKHPTEEARKKMSLAKKGKVGNRLGRKLNPEQLERVKKGNQGKNIGRVLSEETRRKISESNKGKKQSEEVREKLRVAFKGRKLSEETKAKISTKLKGKPSSNKGKPAWNKGMKMSEEVREKLRVSHKGKKPSEETIYKTRMMVRSRERKIHCRDNGKTYKSVVDAANDFGFNPLDFKNIRTNCYKRINGYYFKFLETINDSK